jgi:hypothetical protein
VSAVEELGQAGDDEVGNLGAERVRLSGAAYADHESESCRSRRRDAGGSGLEGRRVLRFGRAFQDDSVKGAIGTCAWRSLASAGRGTVVGSRGFVTLSEANTLTLTVLVQAV